MAFYIPIPFMTCCSELKRRKKDVEDNERFLQNLKNNKRCIFAKKQMLSGKDRVY